MKKISLFLSFLLTAIFLCSQEDKPIYKHVELELSIERTRKEYNPDKRISIFDIRVSDEEKQPTIIGKTSNLIAYEALIKDAKKTYGNQLVDKVELLPSTDLGDKTYGVINLSVADIREEPDFTKGMATQSILGTPIRIYEEKDWYRIQTPDGYIGWSQLANFHPMNKEEFNEWIAAEKIIFTDYFGFSYSKANKSSQTITDLVNGNMLRLEGTKGDFYKVSYPDGKVAYVLKSQAKPYREWEKSIELTQKSIVDKAFTLMGIPYMWGGTSIKGMDCSGYTKTVLFMHGIILMRDASQQVNTGIPVEISHNYDGLEIGDLMFFGKKGKDGRERIRHVGFYIGNQKFIHASGSIRISSIDPEAEDYDEANAKEFIRATRIIGAVDTNGIWDIDNNPMYKIQE